MPPLLLAPLFEEIGRQLVALLRSLSPEDWQQPTSSSARTVKDVATHLLDGSLRRLSLQRDGYSAPGSAGRPGDGEPLQGFLNRLNAEWERGTARLSPRVLTDLIEWTNPQLARLFGSLDPHVRAMFTVAWAGESESANWFDVAREYTEKWHHTRQIFEATGRPSTIDSRELMLPCLDAFMRALPYTYRDVAAPAGASLEVRLTGDAGGSWYLVRHEAGWQQMTRCAQPKAVVTMPPLTFWRLVTKRRTREAVPAAFPEIEITGAQELGVHVLDMVSMMA